jgi:hypothetical protein
VGPVSWRSSSGEEEERRGEQQQGFRSVPARGEEGGF